MNWRHNYHDEYTWYATYDRGRWRVAPSSHYQLCEALAQHYGSHRLEYTDLTHRVRRFFKNPDWYVDYYKRRVYVRDPKIITWLALKGAVDQELVPRL